MNQKDYKEIARIIKGWKLEFDYKSDYVMFVNEFVDYFEKRYKDLYKEFKQTLDIFDRKQFKEWCGVEK